MGPGEEGELPHVVPLHQGEDEPHETDDVPVEEYNGVEDDERLARQKAETSRIAGIIFSTFRILNLL